MPASKVKIGGETINGREGDTAVKRGLMKRQRITLWTRAKDIKLLPLSSVDKLTTRDSYGPPTLHHFATLLEYAFFLFFYRAVYTDDEWLCCS